jgi:hypothetical protein
MKFHISDIMSIYDGQLVSTRHVEGVYDILNYLHSTSLFTHQLPRAMTEALPHLIALCPWLPTVELWKHPGDVAVEEIKASIDRWLAQVIEKHGEWHELQPIHEPVHRDPIGELADKVGADKIIVVEMP